MNLSSPLKSLLGVAALTATLTACGSGPNLEAGYYSVGQEKLHSSPVPLAVVKVNESPEETSMYHWTQFRLFNPNGMSLTAIGFDKGGSANSASVDRLTGLGHSTQNSSGTLSMEAELDFLATDDPKTIQFEMRDRGKGEGAEPMYQYELTSISKEEFLQQLRQVIHAKLDRREIMTALDEGVEIYELKDKTIRAALGISLRELMGDQDLPRDLDDEALEEFIEELFKNLENSELIEKEKERK